MVAFSPMRQLKRLQILVIIVGILLVGCSTAEEDPGLIVSLVADGRERTFSYATPVTVEDFLEDAEIEMDELDRVNPQPFTQIADGMVVTVVRVEETTECEETTIPYTQRTVLNEGLAPGEERIGQAGENGIEQICYRVRTENGIEQDAIEVSRTTIDPPQDEVVYVGPTGEIDPVPVDGTLAYISNNNAWVIRGNSTNKQPVTTSSDLDGFVFTLSPSGDQLLFTRNTITQTDDAFANELWLVDRVTSESATPVELVPQNVLQAHWIPNRTDTISYSTGEASDVAPGWRAYNDLWAMRINPQTGEALDIQNIVEESSFGLYSWWGTQFDWSPAGNRLAWVRADSLGLVDLETGEFDTLVEYPVFNTRQSWSWRATVSWTPNENLIATTIHEAIGNYPPETSPAFSAAVVAADGSFNTPIVENSGIWSTPQFSSDNEASQLAYLKARDPFNSINGEYDLILADRDGSNARRIFPPDNQQGLSEQTFVWNQQGTQLALIYQGNLWLVDVETGASHQLTLDSGVTDIDWSN